jgi:hypothetical protein
MHIAVTYVVRNGLIILLNYTIILEKKPEFVQNPIKPIREALLHDTKRCHQKGHGNSYGQTQCHEGCNNSISKIYYEPTAS